MRTLRFTTFSLALLGLLSFSGGCGEYPGLGGGSGGTSSVASGGSAGPSGGASSGSGGADSSGGSSGSGGDAGSGGNASGGGDSGAIGSPCTDDEDCLTTDASCDPTTLVCVACEPRVRILVQRSGTMFETPSAEDNWWNAVASALDNTGADLLDEYAASVDISVSTFHMAGGDETCPELATETSVAPNGLTDFFASQAQEHEVYVEESVKVDAPLPDAIQQAAEELGASGDRYLLLIITGLPDSCDVQDGNCSVGPAVAEVQAAYDAGIKTKLIYLFAQGASYDGYPEGLANAGDGQGVADLQTGCENEEAEFSDAPGAAAFAQPSAVGGVKDALSSIFAGIESCN